MQLKGFPLFFFAATAACFSPVPADATGMCGGRQQYQVTATSMWSEDRHPSFDFPSFPHFSPLVVAAHEGRYMMFQAGKPATPGIETMAETGGTGPLLRELEESGLSGSYKAASGSFGSPGQSQTVSVEATYNHRYLSAVSMLAPSSDWFIGVGRRQMCMRKTASWIKHAVWWPTLYDAGTEERGSTRFSLNGKPTVPQQPIAAITARSRSKKYNPFYQEDANAVMPPVMMVQALADGADCTEATLPSHVYITQNRRGCKAMCQKMGQAYVSFKKGRRGDCRYQCTCADSE